MGWIYMKASLREHYSMHGEAGMIDGVSMAGLTRGRPSPMTKATKLCPKTVSRRSRQWGIGVHECVLCLEVLQM